MGLAAVRFKNSGLPDEFTRAHPRLQALALYLDSWASRRFGKDLFVTDVERTQDEYDSIYGIVPYLGPRPHLGPPSRAIDFRTVGELIEGEIRELVDHANAYWIRSDGKPTAMYHVVDKGAPHIHAQTEAK